MSSKASTRSKAPHWTDPQPRPWAVWDRPGRRPVPAHYFRVRLGPKTRLFVHVEIYATRARLRQAASDGSLDGRWRTIVAQCAGLECRRKGRLRPDVAIIRLTTKSRSGDITHEAFHATCRAAVRLLRIDHLPLPGLVVRGYAPDAEERMAVIHERICIGVINGMWNCGLLRN